MGTGNLPKKITSYHTLNDNYDNITNSYAIENGYFSKQGDSNFKKNRVIETTDPIKESEKFLNLLVLGGKLTNEDKDKQMRIFFMKDGSIITHRYITSVSKSPAIDINIKNSNEKSKIKNQKIHFIYRKEK